MPTRRRDRWRWGPWAFFVGLAALYFIGSRPTPPPEGWGDDYTAALAAATEEERNVLVAFYMPGCVYCDVMDRSVLPVAEVRSAVEGFVPVRVNLMEERELANRVGAIGAPTYVVLDARGNLLAKTEGYQPVESFMQFLSRASILPATELAKAERGR